MVLAQQANWLADYSRRESEETGSFPDFVNEKHAFRRSLRRVRKFGFTPAI